MTPAHIAAAARIYTSRRARDLVFGADRVGFGEPGWDMLLTIVAAGDSAALSEDDLVVASATPDEIARPYFGWLASSGLVASVPDTEDPQRAKVTLTKRGEELMTTYLSTEVTA